MTRRKAKPVSYELIARHGEVGEPMYDLLTDLVERHHEELAEARIALAWCTSWRPTVDGRVTLGKCKKASDLDRELSQWDFVILLRKLFWQHDAVTFTQRQALLDHELCHAAVRLDDHGQPVLDERGRIVYRIRQHDIEEFTAVVERYGCWERDLELFAAALRRAVLSGFKPCERCRSGNPGWVTTPDNRVARCTCWLAWAAQYEEATAAS